MSSVERGRERLNRELIIWSTTYATVLFVTHSLSEAVFLADRVLIISGHPGRLLADVPIVFPRPRTAATIEQPEFLHYFTILCHHLALKA